MKDRKGSGTVSIFFISKTSHSSSMNRDAQNMHKSKNADIHQECLKLQLNMQRYAIRTSPKQLGPT